MCLFIATTMGFMGEISFFSLLLHCSMLENKRKLISKLREETLIVGDWSHAKGACLVLAGHNAPKPSSSSIQNPKHLPSWCVHEPLTPNPAKIVTWESQMCSFAPNFTFKSWSSKKKDPFTMGKKKWKKRRILENPRLSSLNKNGHGDLSLVYQCLVQPRYRVEIVTGLKLADGNCLRSVPGKTRLTFGMKTRRPDMCMSLCMTRTLGSMQKLSS